MENIKEPILQMKDVCISYTSDTMAVKHVSASIQRNTITASWDRRDAEEYAAARGQPDA